MKLFNKDAIWYRVRIIQALETMRRCKINGNIRGYLNARYSLTVYRSNLDMVLFMRANPLIYGGNHVW